MDNMKKRLREVQNHGKSGQGNSEYVKYLSGNKITVRQAVRAKCFDCLGMYADGRIDCETATCALYPFHPYNKNRQKSRVMTPEQRRLAGERLRKIKEDINE